MPGCICENVNVGNIVFERKHEFRYIFYKTQLRGNFQQVPDISDARQLFSIDFASVSQFQLFSYAFLKEGAHASAHYRVNGRKHARLSFFAEKTFLILVTIVCNWYQLCILMPYWFLQSFITIHGEIKKFCKNPHFFIFLECLPQRRRSCFQVCSINGPQHYRLLQRRRFKISVIHT